MEPNRLDMALERIITALTQMGLDVIDRMEERENNE